MSRLIGYARVSTADQRIDLQEDALLKAGCLPENVHSDVASAANLRRGGLRKALADVRTGDTLVVWKLDRLFRSLPHMVNTLSELERDGIGFRSLTEAIDTATPAGRLILHVMASIAQFERDLIAERTRAGMRVSMDRGHKMGRPPTMTLAKIERARKLLSEGKTGHEVAKAIGVSHFTVYQHFPGGRSALGLDKPAKHK